MRNSPAAERFSWSFSSKGGAGAEVAFRPTPHHLPGIWWFEMGEQVDTPDLRICPSLSHDDSGTFWGYGKLTSQPNALRAATVIGGGECCLLPLFCVSERTPCQIPGSRHIKIFIERRENSKKENTANFCMNNSPHIANETPVAKASEPPPVSRLASTSTTRRCSCPAETVGACSGAAT